MKLDAREELEAELDEWRAAGRRPRLFWRDDDAVRDTPALGRLLDLARRHGAPVLVAAIPAGAEASLAAALARSPLATGAVHGWAHHSHSPVGQKPSELGTHRPVGTVLDELRAGRRKLLELFDGRLSALLVPPWNRIDAEVRARVGEAGFAGVSAHGWQDEPGPCVNVHIDNIHWSNGRIGRDRDWIRSELARNLGEARRRGWRAVGVLTHHLAHDDKAWAGIETVLADLGPDRADWVAADDLLAAPDEPPGADAQA